MTVAEPTCVARSFDLTFHKM